MMASTLELLRAAQAGGYAVGAFNVYNLEGALAVVAAAEQERCPAILQIHPAALVHGGSPLVALCLEAARRATVPMAVHLDHCTDLETVRAVLAAGLTSVMADGSRLDYEGNVAFTAEVAAMVHARGGCVEA
ncbi:MAG: class II fructose-bisphosphate aldolase, partial [Caldilineae bacterium]